MHLLDTEIVWALRGARAGRTDEGLTRWAAGQPRTGLFLSALSLAELAAAADQIDRADRPAATRVRQWIETKVVAAFDGRMLAVDAAVARRAALLGYADLRDGLFAATALEHGLTLATRHPAAFRTGRVKTVNPWAFAPEAAAEEDLDWRQAARGGPLWLRNLFARG